MNRRVFVSKHVRQLCLVSKLKYKHTVGDKLRAIPEQRALITETAWKFSTNYFKYQRKNKEKTVVKDLFFLISR